MAIRYCIPQHVFASDLKLPLLVLHLTVMALPQMLLLPTHSKQDARAKLDNAW